MAIVTDAIEGTIGQGLGAMWFHYDILSDVLYIRLASERNTATFADETPQGDLILRRESDEREVGLTLVGWWKRFGSGSIPDSLREIERSIEPLAKKIAA